MASHTPFYYSSVTSAGVFSTSACTGASTFGCFLTLVVAGLISGLASLLSFLLRSRPSKFLLLLLSFFLFFLSLLSFLDVSGIASFRPLSRISPWLIHTFTPILPYVVCQLSVCEAEHCPRCTFLYGQSQLRQVFRSTRS